MIDIIGQPGKPATKEQIEAYKRDCNGCFGAAGGDCQKCQEQEEITDEQAVEAINILAKYCNRMQGYCIDCVHDRLNENGLVNGRMCKWVPDEGVIIPAIRGNTVYYFRDGKLTMTTCGRREEAEELLAEKLLEEKETQREQNEGKRYVVCTLGRQVHTDGIVVADSGQQVTSVRDAVRKRMKK